MEGTIQNIFHDRGFGFIRATSGIKYYFKLTSVRNAASIELLEGQEVIFEDSQQKGLETAEDIYIQK